jgi:hypothetical protein
MKVPSISIIERPFAVNAAAGSRKIVLKSGSKVIGIAGEVD